ncbi:unnamed protein product [Blepharisma stoltei]|uniref:Uncharacterized protein n=1 Tax=Blepharisma stoltei TaxID=1481888 RepID=A0AAU9JVP5_9CILI|nr:unnamed protein product [Blepharisma stoltei]
MLNSNISIISSIATERRGRPTYRKDYIGFYHAGVWPKRKTIGMFNYYAVYDNYQRDVKTFTFTFTSPNIERFEIIENGEWKSIGSPEYVFAYRGTEKI